MKVLLVKPMDGFNFIVLCASIIEDQTDRVQVAEVGAGDLDQLQCLKCYRIDTCQSPFMF